MKKIFSLAIVTLMLGAGINAQQTKVVFSKGTTFLQGGLGIGAGYFVGSSSLPPLQVRVEKAINDEFSVGGIVGVAGSKYSDSYGSIKYSYTMIGARGNYHFETNDKLDPYVGATLGYNIFSVSDDGYTYGGYTAKSSAVLYGGQIGVNYYFSPHVGAWAELGYGVAYLNLGVVFKL